MTLGTENSVHIAFSHENSNWRGTDWFVFFFPRQKKKKKKTLKNNLHANENSFPAWQTILSTEAQMGMRVPSSGHFLF